jgi:hypothetical protein
MWHYTPPQDRGQFNMPNYCISCFAPIVEMIYLEAITICLLMQLNKMGVKRRDSVVATGSLKYECATLENTCHEHAKSLKEEAMFYFISKFNRFNHFSLLAYPVGMYMDHFKEGKESIKNKMLLCKQQYSLRLPFVPNCLDFF